MSIFSIIQIHDLKCLVADRSESKDLKTLAEDEIRVLEKQVSFHFRARS